MKLEDVKRTDKFLVIITDDGERKQSLKWEGVDELEKRCSELKGRLIETSTWNPEKFSPKVWFQDIWEVDEQGNRIVNEEESQLNNPEITSLLD